MPQAGDCPACGMPVLRLVPVRLTRRCFRNAFNDVRPRRALRLGNGGKLSRDSTATDFGSFTLRHDHSPLHIPAGEKKD